MQSDSAHACGDNVEEEHAGEADSDEDFDILPPHFPSEREVLISCDSRRAEPDDLPEHGRPFTESTSLTGHLVRLVH